MKIMLVMVVAVGEHRRSERVRGEGVNDGRNSFPVPFLWLGARMKPIETEKKGNSRSFFLSFLFFTLGKTSKGIVTCLHVQCLCMYLDREWRLEGSFFFHVQPSCGRAGGRARGEGRDNVTY